MIAGRLDERPQRGFRVAAREIVQDGACVIEMLGPPLALRNQHPVERLARAALQRRAQKHLLVPQKRDLAAPQAQLFPQQTH